jgi:hypothetical protein
VLFPSISCYGTVLSLVISWILSLVPPLFCSFSKGVFLLRSKLMSILGNSRNSDSAHLRYVLCLVPYCFVTIVALDSSEP